MFTGCLLQAWQSPLSQQMVLLGKQTVVMRFYLSSETLRRRVGGGGGGEAGIRPPKTKRDLAILAWDALPVSA